MTPAFTTFMAGLIDYAGLFPPAGLAIGPAVREYAHHRAQPESWMLGRFIAPADRLGAVAAAAADSAADAGEADAGAPAGTVAPWAYSVLVGSRTSAETALAALPGQGASIAAFAARGGKVEVLECPLPADCCGNEANLRRFLDRLAEAWRAAGLTAGELFLELPDGATAVTDIADALVPAGIDALRRDLAGDPRFPRIGAKLRCGGLTPAAFPAPARVAAVVQTCAELGIPLKCTAGLHHPLRHRTADPAFDQAVMMYGFLNVMGAVYLAHGAALQGRGLQECLEETDPRAFDFGTDGFSWRGHTVSVPALAALRRDFVCGFGSCSFAEPVADLAGLGWI